MFANRSIAGGLPSGPRIRSVARPTDTSPTHSSTPRIVRPQRSFASIPRDPYHSTEAAERHRANLKKPSRANTVRNDSTHPQYVSRQSHQSSTSSESSLFTRQGSISTPRTSIDDSDRPSYDQASSLRKRRQERSNGPKSEYARVGVDTGTGDGYTIWNRVAEAASEITINVSKAWSQNITTFTGEETPPGKESRLTRAMKAYHRDKAQSPKDLPDWLFTEQERRVIRPPDQSHRYHEDIDQVNDTPRGFRDIYAAASASGETAVSGALPRRGYTQSNKNSPKPADRLKALRDAKRAAPRFMDQATDSDINQRRTGDATSRPRVGLPSGPMVRLQRR